MPSDWSLRTPALCCNSHFSCSVSDFECSAIFFCEKPASFTTGCFVFDGEVLQQTPFSSHLQPGDGPWCSLGLLDPALPPLSRGQEGGVKSHFKWYQFVETAGLGKVPSLKILLSIICLPTDDLYLQRVKILGKTTHF